jgi:hemerythrin-like domain-containing protein
MSTQTTSQTDVRLYKVVHQMFRQSTTRLVDATAKLEPSALEPVIRPHWDFYAAILHHHHHTEDVGVFPALLAVRPEMRSTIDMLEDEHVELGPNIDAVHTAVAAFVKRPDASAQLDVHDALVTLRDWFFPHLDLEDEKILPAVA